MRRTESPDLREAFVQKVVEHLYRTVADKLAVLMDRQGLSEAEAAEAVARLRARLGSWSPGTTESAEQRTDQQG